MAEPNPPRDTPELPPDRLLDLPTTLEMLILDGRLSRHDAETLLIQPRTKRQLGMHALELLAEQEFKDQLDPQRTLDLDLLTAWLAQKAGQPVLRIDPLRINVPRVTQIMSYAFAQRNNILVVDVRDDDVLIASAQPFMRSWEAMLAQTIKPRRITRVVADPAAIARYLLEFYTMARSVLKASEAGVIGNRVSNFEQMLELGQMKSPEANDAHIVNIVDWLLQYAFDQRASDIHVEPRRDLGHIRFRIDGVLHHVYELPPQVTTAVVSRLKILGRMDVAEKRRPQDGRLKTKSQEGNEVELRLSTLPTAFGEKLVMRIFDPDVLLRTFAELGLQGEDEARWRSMVTAPNGIVLVTGPTGSGKTTTLYSSLKMLATPEVNVCTVEDPIEMVEPAFNQMQVQQNIDLTFAAGLRSLLRQDPDIIMVGEIRDLETAEMAVQAALTGHLVISTLHTNDAPSAVTRILELGVPAYLIKATVLGVMAQRLVRTLCPHCKQQEPVDTVGWALLTKPFKGKPPAHVFGPRGCLECRGTGYLGRIGLYELLKLSDSVRHAITPDTDLEALRRQGMLEGMRPLRVSGAQKVAGGITTIAEVLRVAPASQAP